MRYQGLSACLLLFRFFVFPSIDKRERLKRALQVKAESLEEMIALKSEYSTINQRANSSRMAFGKQGNRFYPVFFPRQT